MQKKNNILRLTESAIMIALAAVLSKIEIVNMPMGGSVTAFSMVPILIIAYRYGVKWGIFTGSVYGLFQMLLGMDNLRYGTSALAVAAIILFDYLVAFGVLGLGGLFRGKLKNNQAAEMAAGALVASILRYLCHFVSGVTVWAMWAPEGMPAWLYSLSYNATYMVPEAIISVVGVALISLYLDFSGRDITRRAKRDDTAPERNNTAFVAKLTGISVIIVGLLSIIYQSINVLLSPDGEIVATSMLQTLGISVIIGVFLYALGEIVQLLSVQKH